MANRQVCAMAIEENGNTTLHYVYTDHLGSINAVTNAAGVLEAKLDFDAWGRRRNPFDYSYLPNNTVQIDNGLNNSSTLPAWLYRGYTGHEMLDEFTLINMNARLYDPVLGLMAGVDNVVQAPNYTQNYCRYSYCDNNPLKYTDPDGNRFTAAHLALAGIGGQAAWGPLMQHARGQVNGWQALGLYGVNAAAFVVAGAAGSAVGSVAGTIAGATTAGLTGGAISGAGSYAVQHSQNGIYNGNGADLWQSTWTSAVSGAASGAITAGVGGVLGSFVGGASGSVINDALNGENINWSQALISGGMSAGAYLVATTAEWKFTDGNIGGRNYTLGSYIRMQGALQRYAAWGKSFEIGANIYGTKGGRYKFGRIRYGNAIGKPSVNIPFRPKSIGDVHSHTRRGIGLPHAGPGDVINLANSKYRGDHFMEVWGDNGNVYSSTKLQNNSLINVANDIVTYEPSIECVNDWSNAVHGHLLSMPNNQYYILSNYFYFNRQ